MNHSKEMRVIRNLFTLSFDEIQNYINDNINDSLYELFLAQKVLQSIYSNRNFSDFQKQEILKCLMRNFPCHKQEIKLNYDFIQTFFPIANKIYYDIKELIKLNFDNSLFIFAYCLGIYIQKNPGTICTAKKALLTIAKKSLNDDLSVGEYRSRLVLADSIYSRRKKVIEIIYQKAIKYGVIQEKYDAICFCREHITNIISQGNTPIINLVLSDPSLELGLQRGSDYSSYLANIRKVEEPGFVHSYYKCNICRYCLLKGVSEEDKGYAFELLNRQYSQMNITDMFYFFTGDMPSYIFSLISLLYTELLKLIMFSDDDTFIVLEKSDIKRQMLWGNQISTADFELCYSLVLNHETIHGYFLPIKDGEAILIGKWMFDLDLSIVERAKDVAFDCSKTSKLGKGTNFFGKDVFEVVIRKKICDFGWQAIHAAVKLKQNKNIITDVDLIAFKNGIVLVGQLKVAHCGRDSYQIWKTEQVIKQAFVQVRRSVELLTQDPNLLYSILKKEGIVTCREQIKMLIPIVITSSNYFIGLVNESNVAVVSFDMLCETMYYAQDDKTNEITVQSLTKPISLYSFGNTMKKVVSEIDQDEFHIFYEEYESAIS